MDIALSLISHTNVGKTTLARTLLQRDVGEVRDAPHVTEFADRHLLIENAALGHRLMLWDTPGFGDSTRLHQALLARLQARDAPLSHPLDWLLSQTWDRWRNRAFWASQQAMRHIREESTVVLYLVNASEPKAGYIAPEMELLGWMKRPVLVLLNQLGAPREAAQEQAELSAWRAQLSRWPHVRAVLPMDAFARCWVHEHALLDAVAKVLDDAPAGQHGAMVSLAQAWRQRQERQMHSCMQALAQSLARTALMSEVVAKPASLGGQWQELSGRLRQSASVASSALKGLASKVQAQLSKADEATPTPSGATASEPGTAQQPLASQPSKANEATEASGEQGKAIARLRERIQAELRRNTAELLALHGLVQSKAPGGADPVDTILQRVASQVQTQPYWPEGQAAMVGGVITGALAGLKADMASGGLTLGGGMVAGAILGALGAAGLARGINKVRGVDGSAVALNPQALLMATEAALLRYLAVAHFGRGRGEWEPGEAPAHWAAVVRTCVQGETETLLNAFAARSVEPEPIAAATAAAEGDIDSLTPAPTSQARAAAAISAALAPGLAQALGAVLASLYPKRP